jgi:hypothetical protein
MSETIKEYVDFSGPESFRRPRAEFADASTAVMYGRDLPLLPPGERIPLGIVRGDWTARHLAELAMGSEEPTDERLYLLVSPDLSTGETRPEDEKCTCGSPLVGRFGYAGYGDCAHCQATWTRGVDPHRVNAKARVRRREVAALRKYVQDVRADRPS